MRPVILATLFLVCLARSSAAQAVQPLSVQGSALYTVQSFGEGNDVGGAGFEAQLRYNPSRFSFGLGYQYSAHSSGGDDIKLSGVFFEPRFLFPIGSGRVAPYVAGRVAMLRLKNDFANYGEFSTSGRALGVGAGFLTRLTYRLNLDIGGAVLRQTVEDKTTPSGLRAEFPQITGFVLKGGLTIGF